MERHPRQSGDFDVALGARLRALRVARNLSQEKISSTIGVTCQQIHKYERGINRISVARLYDYLRAIDVDIDKFMQSPFFQIENTKRQRRCDAALNDLLPTIEKICNEETRFRLLECFASIAEIVADAELDTPKTVRGMAASGLGRRRLRNAAKERRLRDGTQQW